MSLARPTGSPEDRPVELRVTIHASLAELDQEAWNSLLPSVSEQPFVSWEWLSAFERSGCVGPNTEWTPSHIAVWRGTDLVAAMPTYIKTGSDGDFSRDWGWAQGIGQAGLPYYPKLVVGVPFTPVTGRRLLMRDDEDGRTLADCLQGALRSLARSLQISVIQVLFPTKQEVSTLTELGFTPRIDFQYHWQNHGYRDLNHFWERFDSKRRNQFRREWRSLQEQEITLESVYGDALLCARDEYAELAFRLHDSTIEKLPWGRSWLNLAFYRDIFARMPGSIELVLAKKAGRVVAGTFNVATQAHLYGRYWGCFEEFRNLHFNVCFYHSISECISRGRQTFEGGAGGEHKLARGFEPMETYSAHAFLDARFERAIVSFIAHETLARERALADWRQRSPIFKKEVRP